MIVDYENPLKKVAEQFVPHQQVGMFFVASDFCNISNTEYQFH